MKKFLMHSLLVFSIIVCVSSCRGDKASNEAVLVLSGKEVSSLEEINQYPAVEDLSIIDTNISDLSPIENNAIITVLALKNNKCSNITPISTMENLEKLFIAEDTQIKDFSCLKENCNLRDFQIYSMDVTGDSGIFDLDQVEYLVLYKTNLESVSEIHGMKSLRSLYILNLEKDLEGVNSILELKQLNKIAMSGCGISDISFIAGLKDLEYVCFDQNDISDISYLGDLLNLEELYLAQNRISNIDVIYNLENLRYLDLSQNPLDKQEIEALKSYLPNCEIVF